MKRVTIAFDDETLYRTIKVEAARSGRTTKEIVVEALRDWLERKTRLTPEESAKRHKALELADQVRAMMKSQGISVDVVKDLHAAREERARQIEQAAWGKSTSRKARSAAHRKGEHAGR